MNEPTQFIIQLVPFLVICVIFGLIAWSIAKRKVKNRFLWTLGSVIPFFNMWAFPTLLSKTDQSVLREIDELRAKIAQLETGK